MNIKCKSCNNDIELLTIEPGKEKSLTCQKCGTPLKIRPRVGTEGFDVIFDPDKRKLRSCINCSKQFYAPATEVIPLCPNCRDESSIEQQELNAYYVLKSDDSKKGPYSLEMIGEWIKDGLLSANDIILSPDKTRHKIFDIPELTPYIKAYSSITRKKEVPKSEPKISRTSFRMKALALKFVSILFILALAIWIYLVLKPAPQKPAQSTVVNLLKEWQKSYPSLEKGPEIYFREGTTLLKEYTATSCNMAKNRFIKAFLQSNGDTEILPFIAMALTCVYDYKNDKRFTLLANDLVNIAMSKTPSASTYTAKADILLKQGKLEESKAAALKALEERPDDPFANLILGRCLLHIDPKSKEGLRKIQESLEDGSLKFGYFILGMNALKREDIKNALDFFNKKIEKNPDPETLYQRAIVLSQKKSYDPAISDLKRSLKMNPDKYEARILLNKILFKIKGNLAEPLRQLNALLSRKGPSRSVLAEADLILSSIYLMKKRYEDSLKASNHGLRIRPTDPYLKINKMRAILERGMGKDRALALIEGLSSQSAKLPGYADLLLAQAFENAGMSREEFDILLAYTENKPRYFYPFAKIAINLLKKKESAKAKKLLRAGIARTSFYTGREFTCDLRAPNIDISIPKITAALSKASASLMNSDFAALCNALIELQGVPDTLAGPPITRTIGKISRVLLKDRSIADAYLLQGILNMKKSRLKKSEELLKKAGEMDINASALSLALGMNYSRQGRNKEAEIRLQEAMREEDLRFLARYEYGLVLLKNGKREEALKIFEEIKDTGKDYYPLRKTLYDMEK